MLMLWFELVHDCNATVNGRLSATALILSDGLLILFFFLINFLTLSGDLFGRGHIQPLCAQY